MGYQRQIADESYTNNFHDFNSHDIYLHFLLVNPPYRSTYFKADTLSAVK